MERDTKKMRGEKPFLFTNLKNNVGTDLVEEFIIGQGLL
jgi:urease accessory protein